IVYHPLCPLFPYTTLFRSARVLASALEAEHYEVVVTTTGEDAFYRANAELFDVVLLDLMLPGRSGMDILQTLRQRHIETPVLIRSEEHTSELQSLTNLVCR